MCRPLFLMFKLQSPLKYSPFHAVHLSRCFFYFSKQFLNLLILLPFSTSAVFCFTSSTSAKPLPLRTYFIWGNKKKCWSGWIGRVGHRSRAIFGRKLQNTQHGVGRSVHKSPIMKLVTRWRVFKKIHWSWMQPLTTMPAGTLIQMGS